MLQQLLDGYEDFLAGVLLVRGQLVEEIVDARQAGGQAGIRHTTV